MRLISLLNIRYLYDNVKPKGLTGIYIYATIKNSTGSYPLVLSVPLRSRRLKKTSPEGGAV